MNQTSKPCLRNSVWIALVAGLVISGCVEGPVVVPVNQRQTIDRSLVEYPSGFELQAIIRNLTAPTAMAFGQDGTLVIVNDGMSDRPRIIAYKPDGTAFDIYPRNISLPFGIAGDKLELVGPIGGMVAANGKVYVAHRDRNRRGVVTAFDIATGAPSTVVADLPTEGEHGVLDLVLSRNDGRLYFSIGSITNSGVVGLDNWQQGWVIDHEQARDIPAVPLKLLGYRFDTPNPNGQLWTGRQPRPTNRLTPGACASSHRVAQKMPFCDAPFVVALQCLLVGSSRFGVGRGRGCCQGNNVAWTTTSH